MADGPRKRFQPRDAIRLGLRIHPATDLYYQLMRGSWLILVAVLVAGYLLANVAFALLYMADMRGISQAETGGFAEAFEFSVQTISTIGYGGMSPTTPYVHMLVTAEAMVGILGFAIATGLMFQKFSRPRALVRFSEPMIISVRDGKPVLMFRLANARGNEIIEASIGLTMLKTEISEEGHRMRRLHDCKLMRTMTPLFVMTWLVIHEIDETSPLYGMTPADLEEDNAMFIVTMTGIDSTFSATVHARTIYYAEDVRYGARFVDVVSFTEEGQAQIDYTRFDETAADPAGLDPLPLMTGKGPQNSAASAGSA